MKRLAGKLLQIDSRDGMAVAGMGLVGAGTWTFSPGAALIVVGAILLAVVFYSTRVPREEGE